MAMQAKKVKLRRIGLRCLRDTGHFRNHDIVIWAATFGEKQSPGRYLDVKPWCVSLADGSDCERCDGRSS